MATVWMIFAFVLYFISLTRVKIFAEFENVALHKPAYQSSYYSDEHFSQRNASLAVDGETRDFGDNYIHTAKHQPYTWWEVDLGKLYFVQEVKIYFRQKIKKSRRGVQIYTNTAANTSDTGHLCGTVTGSENASEIPYVVNFTCNVNARYVTVYHRNNTGLLNGAMLQFVEVEVYACEVNVKYGSNCDKMCKNRHCVNTNSTCDVQTGKCDTAGCTAGWTGSDCTQRLGSCELNVKYGSNCEKLCEKRHCVNTNSSCDVQTGKCDTAGCKAGWTGTDCTQECGSGSYGSNCNFICGHCTNGACDFVTGHCKDGCNAGYLGPLCKEKCGFGSYGSKCNFTCGHCTNGACDFVTGHCKDGCNAGYLGRLCKTKCGSGTHGLNCNLSCDNCENKTCNHISGTCISGCIDGFVGDLCMERIVAGQDQAVTISGYTLGVVAIVVVVAILLFVIKRRREMSSRQSNPVDLIWQRNYGNDAFQCRL